MKISIVTSHPIQYQAPLFRELARRPNVASEVLFLRLPDEAAQGEGFGVSFRWDIPLLDGYSWKQGTDIRADLSRSRPDCVLIMGWHDQGLLKTLWEARRLGIPRIVRGDSNGLIRRNPCKRLAHKILLEQFDAFVAVGRANRDFYISSWIDPGRIFRSPYFVDNVRFLRQADEHRRQRAELRSGWGIPQRSYCFVFAGKFGPEKRPLDLVRALAVAGRKLSCPVHALLVGTGPLLEATRRACDEAHVPVSLAGFLNQSEITRAYTAADCLVLPSGKEAWGLVVNEAMVCGLPAIVSDRVGCGPDLITADVTGWTYPCGDVEALADRLCRAAGDPDRASRIGSAARDRVLAAYTVEAAADGILEAAERLDSRARR